MTSGFFQTPKPQSDKVSVEEGEKEDNESLFRSSLKGFFTGQKKAPDSNMSMTTWSSEHEEAEFLNENDRFAANSKSKEKKSNMFLGWHGDQCEAKNIGQLIQEFKTESDFFKSTIKKVVRKSDLIYFRIFASGWADMAKS